MSLYTERDGACEEALSPVVLAVTLEDLRVALQPTPALFAPLHMSRDTGALVFVTADFAARD